VLALQIDPLCDGEIGGGSAVIVGVEGDLLVARAAGERPIEDFSEFVNLVPGNDAPFDWA
jgi:hypothetical protein